ncbi:flagellar basal body-associated protein FliL [Solidesulfovibrio carbinoliphilus subsp. oakridgensis]|uniref:Flagellar protein FliL n=1 Tax=Solidesulfovibrio carbinoliphilus subsp. oakridgensis TaxID=694327 RepID=G7Q465_9BACT|nr:flagellar basal body-associated FliL family protein [Solidesulfovibrio carbinoliphilus]EHJ46855.1 flagellar basal body-associated protein FliL [Solidesulfovibrio carbinoliphilus subsp. oakridgensis]
MVADDGFDSQIKAKLDDSELSDDLPKALQKVDLDLDDAPFLEDEAEEPAPSAVVEESTPFPATDEEAKPSRKKLFVLVGAVLFLLLAGAAAFFLLKKTPPAPPPVVEEAPPPVEAPAPVVPTPPPPEPPAVQPEIIMAMDPFLIELADPKGRTRFLTIRFTAVTREPAVELEFKRNLIVVRDAVYYYLKNKNLEFLTDKNNADALKKDVLSVINQFIGAQPLDNLLIEDYLVK